MAEELAKVYDPKKVEDRWYATWVEKGYFVADPSSKKKAYCIVIPPPNVTGVLTMGHVLNNTLQDILCRRKRMQGFEVLWLPGTDHAGIATQTVVERTLKKDGVIKHRDDLGREKFVEKVWEWRRKHGSIIIQQLKKLGCSCDWTREVFTMDGLDPENPNPRVDYPACVQKVFVDLYKKGLIYRGVRMVNWCPVSRTALSDEEVDMKEVDSHLWYLRYPLIDEEKLPSPLRGEGWGEGANWSEALTGEYIIVATTRPETMLGDEAVAVNPKDKRYKNMVGRKVLLPLQNRPIPVIADPLVEKEFGTGAVKVTPAHDPADYEMGLRHKLPVTEVIGPDGLMTMAAGEKYEGLDRFECRRAVVFDLEEGGLMEKVEPYKHNVGFSQRADVPVEPRLSEQWFLKYPSAKKALKAVTDGKIRFWPDRWVKVYAHWMNNIRDWCISRQLWWGHRIPAWYCQAGIRKSKNSPAHQHTSTPEHQHGCPPIVSVERPKKCPNCGGTEFEQEPDVLDTWFSSWLWPFATMGWPEATKELKKFYPTTDLVTGPDIIFFWVARMIMAGYEFMGKRPFDNVYYTGIIRDVQGRKMSKSLGNSPEPLVLIDRYGADGIRFGLMLIAPKGQDILFSEDRVEVGRNFMNKLWNAARFVLMNLEGTPSPLACPEGSRRGGEGWACPERSRRGEGEVRPVTSADKWILNRLQHATRDINKALDHYQFDTAARAIYQFVWGEFCDWYVELSKTQLANEDSRENTQHILVHVLDNILRLLHPFAPFITEEIWQRIPLSPLRGVRGEGAKLPSPLKGEGWGGGGRPPATINFAQYPTVPKKILHAFEAHEMQTIMEVIRVIRNIRGEHGVQPGKKISAVLVTHDRPALKILEKNRGYIIDLARTSEISILFGAPPPKEAAAAVAGPVEVFVPFAGLIDVGEEKERLLKEIAKIDKNIERLASKLSNKEFIKKAPKEVVEKEKGRLAGAKKDLEKLNSALEKL